jgi:hypothetical protein
MKPIVSKQFAGYFSTGLLLGPEGWRQWAIHVQPVKQISGFDTIAQPSRHL